MNTLTVKKSPGQRTSKRNIPKTLVYEMVKGKPVYYHNYEQILSGEKTLEEIMGSSVLQAYLVTLIMNFLLTTLNAAKYLVMTNEIGFQLAPKHWRALDIAIFDKASIRSELLSAKYAKTAPKIVIEIDTKADLKKYGDMVHYMTQKTDELLDAGVEKVIWILTAEQKVMVAEQQRRWFITTWDEDIEIIEKITLNIEKVMKEFSQ
jgi:hypothetical protein